MIDDYNTSDLPVNVTRGRENSILERKRHGSDAHSLGGSGLKSFIAYSPQKIFESANLALKVRGFLFYCSFFLLRCLVLRFSCYLRLFSKH
jgi:hypothetical protein